MTDNRMKRQHWVLVSLLLAIGLPGSGTTAGAQPAAPNILLVIADDMGLDVSPCHPLGADKPHMPVLEAMCRDGLVFDNVWATPVCSPTRATILTGRYGFRTGVQAVARRRGGIGLKELSVHRLITENAAVPYDHAVIGKWHLSDASNGDADNPGRMGVAYYSGLLTGALRDYFKFPLTTNGQVEDVHGYATTVFTDLAIDWLAGRDGPWFLWLAYTAPHTPFHLPPSDLHDRDLVDSAQAIRANPRPYFLAALEALDHELGRLLASLDPQTRANTITIFLGDNGTPNQVAGPPYSRRTVKGTLFPGGIRVPMVVAGAGVTRKGARETALINTTDLFATIAGLAGIDQTPAEDSISFLPLLATAASGSRTFVYSDVANAQPNSRRDTAGWTIADGRNQYLELDSGDRYLFDLTDDPGATTNLLDGRHADAEATATRLMSQGRKLRASH